MHTPRLTIFAAAVAAIAATVPAHAASTTTATVTTWIAGQRSPEASGSATWSSDGTQLDARATAPVGAKTEILATWIGPKQWFKKGATMLSVDATVRDQPAPTTPDVSIVEQYRICAKKCAKWQTAQLDATPYVDLGSPTGASDNGLGLNVTWPGKKAYLHVEWRLTASVSSGDLATIQASVTG